MRIWRAANAISTKRKAMIVELTLAIAQTKSKAYEATGILYAATLVEPTNGAQKNLVLNSLYEFGHIFVQYFGEAKWVEIERSVISTGSWKGPLQPRDEYSMMRFFGQFAL